MPTIDTLFLDALSLDALSLRLSEQLSGLPPDASQVKRLLSQLLGQLDVVTREEFDAQAAVLQRTREKVEQLEQVLARWEASFPQE